MRPCSLSDAGVWVAARARFIGLTDEGEFGLEPGHVAASTEGKRRAEQHDRRSQKAAHSCPAPYWARRHGRNVLPRTEVSISAVAICQQIWRQMLTLDRRILYVQRRPGWLRQYTEPSSRRPLRSAQPGALNPRSSAPFDPAADPDPPMFERRRHYACRLEGGSMRLEIVAAKSRCPGAGRS